MEKTVKVKSTNVTFSIWDLGGALSWRQFLVVLEISTEFLIFAQVNVNSSICSRWCAMRLQLFCLCLI